MLCWCGLCYYWLTNTTGWCCPDKQTDSLVTSEKWRQDQGKCQGQQCIKLKKKIVVWVALASSCKRCTGLMWLENGDVYHGTVRRCAEGEQAIEDHLFLHLVFCLPLCPLICRFVTLTTFNVHELYHLSKHQHQCVHVYLSLIYITSSIIYPWFHWTSYSHKVINFHIMVSLFVGFLKNVTPWKKQGIADLIYKVLTYVTGVFSSDFYFTLHWYVWSYYNMN